MVKQLCCYAFYYCCIELLYFINHQQSDALELFILSAEQYITSQCKRLPKLSSECYFVMKCARDIKSDSNVQSRN